MKKCLEMTNAIQGFKDYSCRKKPENTWNAPVHGEGESAERLFLALGIKDISMTAIDIAHRVLASQASNKPSAIISKFTRRLTKDKVMSKRRRVSTCIRLVIPYLGFEDSVQINDLTLFDHLSPRVQGLLYEAKTFKNENDFKFRWAKRDFCFSTQDGLL